MNLMARIAGLAVGAAVTIGSVLVAAPQAQAATAYDTMAAKAKAACGMTHIVTSKRSGANPYTGSDLSRLFVLYGNGYNCAVHVKYSASELGYISVNLENDRTGTVRRDGGFYKQYAGPVKVYAPNDCVTAWGGIDSGERDYTIYIGSVGCN